MFHTAVFNANIPNTNTLTGMNLIADEHWTPNPIGVGAIAPYDGSIKALYSIGASLARSQLQIPSLKRVGYPEVYPLQVGATVPSYPVLMRFSDYNRPTFKAAESITPLNSQGGAAAETERFVIWGEPNQEAAPPGVVFPFRFTATIAGVVDSWATGPLVLSDTLPIARYAVVGMSVVGANILAARLVFPGGGPRPGVLGDNAIGNGQWPYFRFGNSGKFGDFIAPYLPQLQIYCVGANAAQTVVLDLIKLGDM